MQFIYAYIILTFSDEPATTKSKGNESDSSPRYENPVFDQSKTDVHTYEDLDNITRTYQDRRNDAQSNDDIADHIYLEPDQVAKYVEIY